MPDLAPAIRLALLLLDVLPIAAAGAAGAAVLTRLLNNLVALGLLVLSWLGVAAVEPLILPALAADMRVALVLLNDELAPVPVVGAAVDVGLFSNLVALGLVVLC